MKTYNKKAVYIAIAAIVVIIIVIALSFYASHKGNRTVAAAEWKAYTNQDFGLQLAYPSDWKLYDGMTPKAPCCLFIDAYKVSTSTAVNASGTPVTSVTAMERIKLQIGHYDLKTLDPFKAASTTKTTINGADAYVGIEKDGTPFYLFPRSSTEGVGVAIFIYKETDEADKATAKKIVSTMKLVPIVATSTATSTAQ